MDHPTRRLDPNLSAEPPATEHPTRRLDAAEAPALPQATQRLDAAPPAPVDPAQCPKCRGQMIGVRPVGRGMYGVIGDLVLEQPHIGLADGRLEARMCGACGYTEFFSPIVLRPRAPTTPLEPTVAPPPGPVPCAHCRNKVLANVMGTSVDRGGSGQVCLDQAPGAWLGRHLTVLEALVCPHCGRAELYGAYPQRLLGGAPALAAPRPCGQCGQPVLAVRGLDYGGVTVYLQKRKHAAWSGPKISPLTAYTCAECGYTELYATTPDRLLEP